MLLSYSISYVCMIRLCAQTWPRNCYALPLSGSTSHLIIIIIRMISDDDHTNASSGDPCKEIWRTKTKMKITWLDLFVNFWQRIFGKDAEPGELGILGVVLLQEGGVHHFAGSTKPAIGFAPDQATKGKNWP